MSDPTQIQIKTLVSKLGEPRETLVGRNTNGQYTAVQWQDGPRQGYVLVEANFSAEKVADAVAAALAVLARGRG